MEKILAKIVAENGVYKIEILSRLSAFMKYKHIISILLLGVLIYLFGAWSKLTHQAFADNTLLISFCVMMLSAMLAIIKILTTKRKDSFLNK